MIKYITLFSVTGSEILTNNDERYKSHLNENAISNIRNILIENGYTYNFDVVRNVTGKTQPFLVIHSSDFNVNEFINFCTTSGINTILDSGVE